jgi:hypothetical protein
VAAPSDNLPDAATQSGSVFHDRTSATLAWYLPAFGIAPDPDAAFAFAASQSGVDSSGNPFNRAVLTLGLTSHLADDAAAYQRANAGVTMRAIPLDGLAVTLTIVAADPVTGAPHPTTIPGTIAVAANGAISATFSALIGTAVIVAFENLKNGGASLTISASYDVWHPPTTRPVLFPIIRPIGGGGEAPPQGGPIRRLPMMEMARSAMSIATPAPIVRPVPQPAPVVQIPGTESVAAFTQTLAIGAGYGTPAYAAKFLVTDQSSSHVIVGPADLTSFNAPQSEFAPFTALGNVAATYPSFQALYLGALSRTIVAVPARYGVARSSTGTAASCRAVLDSAAGSTSANTFEFSFLLAPVVSPIDLVQLAADVAKNAAVHDCTVTLPVQLDPRIAATLATAFQSAVTITPGAQPGTFAVTVALTDGAGATTPAVANANLLLDHFTASVEPFLTGSFGIKLDDAYATPIQVSAVLNLSVTGGSDEIAYVVDTTSGALTVRNLSPLDLTLTRYALASSSGTTPQPLALRLAAHSTATIVPSGLPAWADVLIDRTLALEAPFAKTDIARYLTFDLQDIQAVAYEVGILAGGITFAARGIAQIQIAVTFADVPTITVPALTLTANDTAANTTVQLPLQYALTSLVGTLAFTVIAANGTSPNVTFTQTNDFIASPVFVLADASIPPFATASP